MPKIGITMGDCAGVGPEIILKALQNEKLKAKNDYVIYGERKVFEQINEVVKMPRTELNDLEFVDFNLINAPVEFGVIKAEYGKAAGEYIKRAIEDAMARKVDAIVTAPIHKKAFRLGGFGEKYPGHTEMLADLTSTKKFTMMLAYQNLRVMHVTIHVSLRKALDMISKENVYQTIKLGYETCQKLKISDIRIGVAGINPHAGDNGLFGDEETKEIEPAVKQAIEDFDCLIEGPVPPDTIFSKAYGGMYDMVICMYHDQGHIPLKTLGFKYNHRESGWSEVGGVNVTIGLPIIRAAVDHGTAFGKAGKGTANADSIMDAINYAVLLASS